MNVSRHQQRVLHALAQGGCIRHYFDSSKKIIGVDCVTREGWVLENCTLNLFRTLKSKGLIASKNGRPYRISRKGLLAVRARPDNR
ncbi:YjhX family toxin [Pelagibius sp. Alg239-R121]|uniref:YjhX family toxin n=1 Tax=Pelagibius sp. Alg239-R121 TaxID=2993448 RepID=UPI0024A6B106|nr:YjhX family toxin [Pelagibius sp. Alg239-R121]